MDEVSPGGGVDEMFSRPYVDVDEWRDAPVRHRYVHGGFAGTETRFSIYLPPAEQYAGRFFQHITPVPDSEYLDQGATGEFSKTGLAIASGAYFVETNGGGSVATPGSGVDPTVGAYRANAAVAQYSRVVAVEMYGDTHGEHRPYGYSYGGSGGGFRTIGGAENTVGVWDGFVPYVIGSPMAIPNVFTVRMHAQRTLRHRFDQIVDAAEPGGSGDIYAGLTDDERDALAEVTRMGFPPRSWFGHRTMGMHAFPVLFTGVSMADPSYFDEFWTTPGYLGHDRPSALAADIVHFRCTVIELLEEGQAVALGLTVESQAGRPRGDVDRAWRGAPEPEAMPVALRLSVAAPADVLGAELIVHSGAAAGARVGLLTVAGDLATGGHGSASVFAQLQPGDEIEVDNRRYLAAQTYHRHQVPGSDYPVWDQFRHADGTARYPQRPLLLGPLFASAASGTVQSGRFTGKMIVVECLLDREAFPWQADWYRARVAEHFGDAIDDHFRLWYVDNGLHGDESERQEHPTHSISYLGVLHQALRDVSAWVERGIVPPASTSYTVVDGQVMVPASADERRGVQPVVHLSVDGDSRADVEAGAEVVLRAEIDVPTRAGKVVGVEWDLDGSGTFATSDPVEPAARVTAERRHAFMESGTHFVTVRVTSQRDGDSSTPYARLQNLARARVVVA